MIEILVNANIFSTSSNEEKKEKKFGFEDVTFFKCEVHCPITNVKMRRTTQEHA